MKRTEIYIIAIFIAISSIITNINAQEMGEFTDARDGQVYKTVKIGDQTWMAENLSILVDDGCSCYDNNQSNCNKYGRLYTWEAAKQAADKIKGWHLPTDAEWKQLETYLGGNSNAGDKLKSTSGWSMGGNGNNSSGFSALPSGYCLNTGGFKNMENSTYFWSATKYKNGLAWLYSLDSMTSVMLRKASSSGDGYSVRLIKD